MTRLEPAVERKEAVGKRRQNRLGKRAHLQDTHSSEEEQVETFLSRRESIKRMFTSVATLLGLGFALQIEAKPHLAHHAGPGPCTLCGCQGFEGTSYICSNYICHHEWQKHQ
jgi:hypothetical protein